MGLVEKMWKSVVAASILLGLISPTGVRFALWHVLAYVAGVLVLAAYWHFMEWMYDSVEHGKQFLKELRADVKFIRKRVSVKA